MSAPAPVPVPAPVPASPDARAPGTPPGPPSPRRRSRPWAGLAALVALVALVAASLAAALPAAAHEGPGILTVETDEPAPTGTGQHYVIRLVWQNDGHPAARDTTVTATPYTPDGTAQTPVPLTAVDDDGRFEATVEMTEPGTWRVQFASVSPVATVDHPAEVAAPTTTSSAPSTTAREPAGEGTGEAAGSAGAGGDDDRSIPDQPTSSESDDDGGSGAVVPLVILALVVVGGAIAAYVVLRRRAAATPGEPSDPTPDRSATSPTGGRDGGGTGDSTTKVEP